MSSIDQRIVEMQFDNKQFESGIQTSMSSLDKLKKTLKFDDASKSLSDLEKVGKNFSLSGVTNGLQTVTSKISALNAIKFTFFQDLTRQAEKFASSLSVDQVMAGWSKYGQKTTSVATLVSQGYELDTVNEQLKRLNWFTDETSYNFTDMVSNIAKFTATGQELQPSVTAMEGIANWAALSGQNAEVASRAMYQLSQAMGKGALKYDDYKSIQNASMDTQEFRQKCLDAAVALGTLKKVGEDTYAVIGAEAHTFDINQFTEYLSTDAWLSSDVMMEVFKQYSAAVDQIYEYSEEKGITASQAIEELGDKVDEFGLKAFKSAQEARTWGDVIDSVKDAVSTGWMNTFELIFGDYEQSVALWTEMANEMYDIFAEPINQINELLEEGLSTPESILGIEDINPRKLGLDATGWTAFQKLLTNVAKEHGIAIDQMIEDEGSFNQTLKNGWLTSDILTEAIGKIESLDTGKIVQNLDDIRDAALRVIRGDYGNDMEQRFAKLTEEGLDAEAVQEYVNVLRRLTDGTWEFSDAIFEAANAEMGNIESLVAMSDAQLETLGYTQEEIDALRELAKTAEETDTPLGKLFERFEKSNGRTLLLDSFRNAFEGIGKVIGSVKEAYRDIFSPMTADKLYSAIKGFNEFTKSLILSDETIEKIKTAFKGVFAIMDIGVQAISALGRGFKELLSYILPSAGGGILNIAELFGEFGVGLRDSVKNSGIFGKAVSRTVNKLKDFVDLMKVGLVDFKEFAKGLKQKFNVPSFDDLKTKSYDVFSSIKEYANDHLGEASGVVSSFASSLKEKGVSAFTTLKESVQNNVGSISDFVSKLGQSLSNIKTTISNAARKIKDFFAPIVKGISDALSGITLGDAIGAGSFAALVVLIKQFVDSFKKGTAGLSDIAKGVVKTLGSVRETLEAYQNNLKAGTLLKIAGAVALLAGSLIALTMVDGDKLAGGLLGVSTLLGEVMATMKLLNKFEIVGVAKAATSMVIISVAISVLAGALAKLKVFQTWDETWPALFAMTGLITGLVVAMKAMSDTVSQNGSGFIKASASLVIFSTAVAVLARAIRSFNNTEWESIGKALVAITAIMTELGIFTKFSGISQITSSRKVILEMALALNLLILPVKLLGSMSVENLAKGIISVGLLLSSMSAAFSDMNGANMKGVATSIASMAAALTLLIVPIEILGHSKLSTLGKGLISVGILLSALTVSMKTLGKTKIDGGGLLAMAAALTLLTIPIKVFSSIGLAGIAVGLVGLAGGLAVVGAAGTLLAPMAPALMSLAGAIAVFGAACLAVGVGVLALSAGLASLAVSGAAGGAALIAVLYGIIEMLPEFGQKLGEGLINFFGALIMGFGEGLWNVSGKVAEFIANAAAYLKEHGAEIWEAAKQLGLDILTALGEGLLFLGETLATFIGDIVSYIAEHKEEIWEAAKQLGSDMLDAIAEGLILVGQLIMDLASNIGAAIMEYGPDILATALDLGKSILTAIGSGLAAIGEKILELATNIAVSIMTYGPDVLSSALDLGKSMITAIGTGLLAIGEKIGEFVGDLVSALAEHASEIWDGAVELAGNLVDGLVSGITSGIQSVVDGVVDLGASALSALKDFLGIASPSKEFKALGEYSSEGFAEGVTKDSDSITESLTSMASAALEALNGKTGEFSGAGMRLASSMSSGMKIGIMQATATSLSLLTLLSLQITQKSSTFAESGKSLIQGLINGMEAKKESSTTSINAIILALINKIKSNVTNFMEAGAALFQGLINGMESKKSSVLSSVTSIFSSVRSTLSTMSSDFRSAGENLVQGLINGINARRSDAINAASDVAKQMIKSTKDELGIHSPSKVFKEIGKNVILGFNNAFKTEGKSILLNVKPFEQFGSKVTKAFEKLNKKSLKKTMKELGMWNTTIDSQDKLAMYQMLGMFEDIEDPVITPVVDLSNLEDIQDRMDALLTPSNVANYSAAFGVSSTKAAKEIMGKQYIWQDIESMTDDQVDKARKSGTLYNGFAASITDQNKFTKQLTSGLKDAISKMNVVTDTGRVIGQIEYPMYDSFQIITGYKERGI